MDDVIHLAIVSVPKQDSMGSFNNYVDKKRWLGGQKKVHAWSHEKYENVSDCPLEGG